MNEEINALLEKAKESLEAAETLADSGHFGFAASRAYYGLFYVAEALLLNKGFAFSKHGNVIAAFGEHFVKTKIFDPKFHRYLIEGFEQRQIGDYEALEKVSESTARTIVERGKEFLEVAHLYLKKE